MGKHLAFQGRLVTCLGTRCLPGFPTRMQNKIRTKLFDRSVDIGSDEGRNRAVYKRRPGNEGSWARSSAREIGNMGSQAVTHDPVAVACHAAPGFQDWLARAGGAVAVSTYQAGKVAMIGWDGRQVTLLMREFDKPLGLTACGDRLVLATRHDLWVLANSPLLAHDYLRPSRDATTPSICRGRRITRATCTPTTWRCWAMKSGWRPRGFLAWRR